VSGTHRAVRITCLWAAALLMRLAAQDTVLHITVVSGEGAVHAAGTHVVKPVTVEVTDGTGHPVEGARVSFQVPAEGPGGVFSTGLQTDLAITGSDGRATVRALQFNRVPGRFAIRVTAAKEQARAGIVAKQYIGEPNATRESADRRTIAPAPVPAPAPTNLAPADATPAATPQHGPAARPVANPAPAVPPRPKTASGETAPATPPRQKSELAMAAPASPRKPQAALERAPSLGQSMPARVPTIILTPRTARPVAGAIVSSSHKSHKKWIWLGVLAAGGVGGAFAGSSMIAATGHGSASAVAAAPVSIGPPTISIGKP
jgi:hypothetical protein